MDVLQFAVDVEDEWEEEDIQEALENAGIYVRCVAWKARWTKEGYDKGERPISCDWRKEENDKMSLRDLIQNGIQLNGPLRIVRYNKEEDIDEVLYYSKDPEHVLLKDEYENFTESEILYMYSITDINHCPVLVIEVSFIVNQNSLQMKKR